MFGEGSTVEKQPLVHHYESENAHLAFCVLVGCYKENYFVFDAVN